MTTINPGEFFRNQLDIVGGIGYSDTYGDVVIIDAVANGDFTTDTLWTKGTGWTIDAVTDFRAECSGAQTAVSELSQAGDDQSVEISLNTTYAINFDITDWTAGTVTPKLGTVYGTAKSGLGSHSCIITCANNTTIAIEADVDFNGAVDNITVREVTQILEIDKVLPVICDTNTNAVLLPLSPTRGNTCGVLDLTGGAELYQVTIGGNGQNIMSLNEDFEHDINRGLVELTYMDAQQGWVPTKITSMNIDL